MDRKTLQDPSGVSFRIHLPSTTASTLCQICGNISKWFISAVISESEGPDYYKHHQSWHELQDSALKGCPLCFQLAIAAEDRFVGLTIAYKTQEGKSTAFGLQLDLTNGEILVRCDQVKWCKLVVTVESSKSSVCT